MEKTDRSKCKRSAEIIENEIRMLKLELLGNEKVSKDYLNYKLNYIKLNINIIDNIVNKEVNDNEKSNK